MTDATPTPTEPTFDRAQLSVDDPASAWVVVDKARPLSPIDYAPADLVDVGGGRLLRAEAAQALDQMIAGAAAGGLRLSIESAYRSAPVLEKPVTTSELKRTLDRMRLHH